VIFLRISFFFRFILVLVLKLVAFLISEKTSISREEMSSYECGFEHNNLSRVPFSMRYFYLTLIFLLFDLEIVLMLFVVYFTFRNFLLAGMLFLISFLIILVGGLYYE